MGDDAVAQDEFEAQIREVLSRHGGEAAGRVYVIDLEALKVRVGKNWPKFAEKVRTLARQTIERHMTKEDLAGPYGETGFLVVFPWLSPRDAQLKCLLIAQEVGRRLFGKDDAAKNVKVRAATLTPDAHISLDPAAEISPPAEPAARRTSALQSLDFRPQLTTANEAFWDEIEFIYRPLLALRGMVVSTFICVPVRRMGEGAFFSGYQALPQSNSHVYTADLDRVTLAKVATDLKRMEANNIKALLCLPVHVNTMSTMHNRNIYNYLCRDHLTHFADRLIFELVELPEGIPQSRLVDLVSGLRPYSRAVIARFPLEQKSFTSFRQAGLHAVGIDVYGSREPERHLMAKLDTFVARATREYLKTYVHGLR